MKTGKGEWGQMMSQHEEWVNVVLMLPLSVTETTEQLAKATDMEVGSLATIIFLQGLAAQCKCNGEDHASDALLALSTFIAQETAGQHTKFAHAVMETRYMDGPLPN